MDTELRHPSLRVGDDAVGMDGVGSQVCSSNRSIGSIRHNQGHSRHPVPAEALAEVTSGPPHRGTWAYTEAVIGPSSGRMGDDRESRTEGMSSQGRCRIMASHINNVEPGSHRQKHLCSMAGAGICNKVSENLRYSGALVIPLWWTVPSIFINSPPIRMIVPTSGSVIRSRRLC